MANSSVRALYESISEKTFEDCLSDVHWTDDEIKSRLKKQLAVLKILKSKANGYSVQGLEKTQEGNVKGVSYTSTFFETVEATGNCHPINYLYLIVKKCIAQGYDVAKTSGIMARSMRTFASLVRDKDFAEALGKLIKKNGLEKNFEISTGAEEDSKNHTDVLVKSKNKTYRIWLYQCTRMGLPHDIERVSGERGELPPGIHVLCPLKSEIVTVCESISSKLNTATKRLGANKKLLKKLKLTTKAYSITKDKIERYDEEISKLQKSLDSAQILMKNEVDVCHGWYLYADSKIEEAFRTIILVESNKTKPDEYSKVKAILLAPKEYLSKTCTFSI